MSRAKLRAHAILMDGAIGTFLIAALLGVHRFDRIASQPEPAESVVEAPAAPSDQGSVDATKNEVPIDPPVIASQDGPKPSTEPAKPLDVAVPPVFEAPRREPAAVVASLFDQPGLNKFGNPEGTGFGLCRTGEFAGARILVWTVDREVQECVYPRDNPLWAALKDKGFEVRLEFGRFDRNWLDQFDQLWIFASPTGGLQRDDVEAIVSFVDAGKGLYLIADNAPFLVDVSILSARLFGAQLSGDYLGDNIIAVRGHGVTRDDYRRLGGKAKLRLGDQDAESRLEEVIGRATHYVEEHPLLTDVNFIFEGQTISHIHPTPRLQVVLTASDGQILAAVSRDPRQRVLVDCGFTRYFYPSDGSPRLVTETAGTLRYAENIAAYLMCKDDKRADGTKWREKRQLLIKYQNADRSTILAGLKHLNPEERWAALIGAIRQRLDIAEALIELLLDSQSEIRGQARRALVQLADGGDCGPDTNASPEECQAAQRAWAKFFKRKRLLARAAGMPPAEIVAEFQQSDPDGRLAAVKAAIDRQLDLAAEFIRLLEDPEAEIRSAAHHALARLARDRDFGPAETATADEIKSAQQAWSLWLKRRDLLARAGKMSPDELEVWRGQSDPDQRWAALMAGIRRRIYPAEQLIELLRDPEPEIRAAAHQALVQLAGSDFGPASDADEGLRAAAISDWHRWRVSKKFSGLVNKAGADAVVAALKAADPEERWAAVIAIRTRRLHLVDELFERLGDAHIPVQQESRQALRHLAKSKDFGPEPGASPEVIAEAVRKWRAWWNQEREDVAAQMLKLAKSLLESNPQAGRRRLEEIVKDFSKTKAAAEARRLLNNR